LVEVVISCVDVLVCLSTHDRYRHVPDRYIPLPISRNIEFVFPPGCSRPVPVPGKQKQEQERFVCFPDRSRPLSPLSVVVSVCVVPCSVGTSVPSVSP
jgi:hypothetical protein